MYFVYFGVSFKFFSVYVCFNLIGEVNLMVMLFVFFIKVILK